MEGTYHAAALQSCLSAQKHVFPITGDVSLSAEDKPPEPIAYKVTYPSQVNGQALDLEPDKEFDYLDEDEEIEHHHFLEGHTALKFLFAGGVAGAGRTSFHALTSSIFTLFICQFLGRAPLLLIG
jgi:hypothetical protein